MNYKNFKDVFPFGSHLARDPMPSINEMKKDIEILADKGFNLVKLQVQWQTCEPIEGVYNFKRHQELIEYAAKFELGVYIGFTFEQAPKWLYTRYPEARMERREGGLVTFEAQTAAPGDGKPGPCYHCQGAVNSENSFIREAVKVLGAYENVVVWNTFQEIGFDSERIIGSDTCYCPNSIAAFQEWLKEKYGTLEELNNAWKTLYYDWDDVVPSRHSGRFALPHNIFFTYFTRNKSLCDMLERRYRIIKEEDVYNRPVFAHQGSSTVGAGIDWNYAQCQDFIGCSCYPAWFHIHQWDDLRDDNSSDRVHNSLLNEMWESVALKFDYLHSCSDKDKPVWGAEFQGGPIAVDLYKGRVPSKEDIRRWMLTTIASGATGISFWVTRAEIQCHELNGYSLLDSVGNNSERLEEASRIGKALNQYADLFSKNNREISKVAIAVNEWNFSLCSNMKNEVEEHITYSVRGWHKFLWERGISVDFVEISVQDFEVIKDYETIILPFPISISEEIAEKLERYVQSGGNLISEACNGRINAEGFCNRGELSSTMKRVFGVEHKNLFMVREPNNQSRWTMEEYSLGDYNDSTVLHGTNQLLEKSTYSNVYVETFESISAEPIMMHGNEVAGAINNYGEGKAIILGTFLGHNATAHKNKSTEEFINTLLTMCDIEADYKGELLLRKRIGDNQKALIFTNPTTKSITEIYQIDSNTKVYELLDGECIVKDNMLEVSVNPLDVKVYILKQQG